LRVRSTAPLGMPGGGTKAGFIQVHDGAWTRQMRYVDGEGTDE
jgi:hypothetical protein